MTLLLLISLILASFGFATAVQMSIGTLKLSKYTNYKPFTCKFCLSFWFAFIMLLIMKQNIMTSFMFGLTCAGVCHFLKLFEDRLTDNSNNSKINNIGPKVV